MRITPPKLCLITHLSSLTGLRNILPITTAKVPIVKFFHLRSGLEVDISLYNTLVRFGGLGQPVFLDE